MNEYQTFIYKRSYSRWMPEENRREEWPETVARYRAFFLPRVPAKLLDDFEAAIEQVLALEVMPSMRCLWSAGPALLNDNIAGYNCAYCAIDSVKSFAEILYILMNGAGVGFSTERQYITALPPIPSWIKEDKTVMHTVEDSKLGWARGFLWLLLRLYDGIIPHMDLSQVRPKGTPLKTFGGRASGPEPLLQLIKFTVKTFKKAAGRKLNSLEVYDIVCMVANCVVSGGVRRSSTINLSNLTDLRMRDAKQGQFWLDNPHRALSNNSVAYTEKPDLFVFMDEWKALARSGAGERGIFNRDAAYAQARKVGRPVKDFGTNPCGEIVLRNKQFCNLTEVVVRPADSIETILPKVKAAVLLGVLQSTLTDFQFLDPEWKFNTEQERLLGVSLTGLCDNMTEVHNLGLYRSLARTYADTAADLLGIPRPAAITTVKPSGTVSQLVDSASGIHPRYAPFYIRRVRVSASDPVATLLREAGVPYHPEVGQELANASTLVFEFPQKAPEGAVLREHFDAIEQLEFWQDVRHGWTDHNPSCTIYVKEDEWLDVGAWVYRHWDEIGGLSFLPFDGGVYELAPYEEIDEDTYNERVAAMPVIPWENLALLEGGEDTTEGSKTLACAGDKCEII
jgi:ribonucleoside-triphosphate reductase